MSALSRSAARDLLRHPLQAALAVVGVALGVAVALAIQLAGASSMRAMELSAEAVGGRATHVISGGPLGLPDALFTRVRLELGLRPSAPVVEEDVPLDGRPGEVLRLLGVDPFCEPPFRDLAGRPGGALDLAAFLTRPGAIVLSSETARRLGVDVGDELPLRVGARRAVAHVVGLLEPADEHAARLARDLLVADVATAQELLGFEGRLTRIDLALREDEETARLLEALRRFLPGDARIEPAGARAGTLAAMTRGFRLNLQALASLSLVVGLFLVYNAAAFSVARRRPELAVLRCVGATRGQVLRHVLGQALAIGAVGSALGVGLGLLLAGGLVDAVAATIQDLWFALAVRELALSPELFGGAFALGLVATLLGSLVPALEATRADPRGAKSRSASEARARSALPRFAVLGVVSTAAGLWLLHAAGARLGLAFGGLFATILGCAALVPPAATLLLRASEPALARSFGAAGALAARGASRSLSRTSVALAALVVALATSTAVGVLISSFRQSVVTWLESAFTADVYVGPPTLTRTRASGVLPDEVIAALAGSPAVERVLRYRTSELESPHGPVQLVALDAAVEGAQRFHNASGGDERDARALAAGEAFFVTEPLAHRLGLARGDILGLATPYGPLRLPVAAIVHDYGSDRGNAVIDLARYRRATGDRATSSLALWLRRGPANDAALAALRERLPADVAVVLRSNADLRDATLSVFDRTFAITGTLRTMTLLVALVGLVSALMALGLDRARELAVLRAIGATPGQVRRSVVAQAVLLGLVAGVLALPVGALVAHLMIDVVNRRTFGWSLLAFDFGIARVASTLAAAVVAAWIAALAPAWRAASGMPSRPLRQE